MIGSDATPCEVWTFGTLEVMFASAWEPEKICDESTEGPDGVAGEVVGMVVDVIEPLVGGFDALGRCGVDDVGDVEGDLSFVQCLVVCLERGKNVAGRECFADVKGGLAWCLDDHGDVRDPGFEGPDVEDRPAREKGLASCPAGLKPGD